MSYFSTWSDVNLIIDEALSVNYTNTIISGKWGFTAANVSGSYNHMRECHRYAKKSFRYVGLTYAAAKACAAAMRTKFMRSITSSYWNSDALGGGWTTETNGNILMADVSCTHADGDEWQVVVSVNEDDVRFLMASDSFSKSIFNAEQQRKYGSDLHGVADETEA